MTPKMYYLMYYYFMVQISGYYGSGSVFTVKNNGKLAYRAVKPLEPVNGKRRFITGSGPTREAAIRSLERNIQRRIARGSTVRYHHTPTVEEFMTDKYLKRDGIEASTLKKVRSDLVNHVIPVVGDMELGQLTKDNLTPLVTDLRQPGSAGWHAIKTFKALLNYAVEMGIIEESPLKNIKNPKAPPAVRDDDDRYIKPRTAIYWTIIQNLKEPDYPSHDLYPLFMTASLGLRPSELIGLTWDCLYLLNVKGKATLTVKQQLAQHDANIEGISGYYIKPLTKNKKKRTIPLPEPWRLALVEQRSKNIKASDGEWSQQLVFLRPNGRHWTRQAYTETWHQLLKAFANSLPEDIRQAMPKAMMEWRVYYIRHMAVSLLTQDTSAKTTSEIIGHSERIDEAIYQHTMSDAMKEAMNLYEQRTVDQWLKDEQETDSKRPLKIHQQTA